MKNRVGASLALALVPVRVYGDRKPDLAIKNGVGATLCGRPAYYLDSISFFVSEIILNFTLFQSVFLSITGNWSASASSK